ncbi:MAG: tRNA dihydrouridine(20/20a) synthase DusA [Alphaproteobacteria bacterium]|nr:tRNA dihydrouridine(20/20a) synthase DusA [Alphaproteobacteria bacterium]
MPAPEISVAPMMDWTDRHCRYFHRLLAPHVKLYTEMVTTGALLFGDKDRHLRFDSAERPLALQLGGSDPDALARCAAMGEEYGYDEINLNCGCPSDRVQNGRFGACLMKEPDHVASCVERMISAVSIPVTVKCRIGIDDQDDFAFLDQFVGRIADKGCKTFIIHARKAWLKGLSPKENREKPPIDYIRAAQIREKYPQLRIIVNGEISTIENVQAQISTFSGVMIGREAYQNPWFLAEIMNSVFNAPSPPQGRELAAYAMIQYAHKQADLYGTPVKSITRHMLGLFHGQPGAKAWKQTLSSFAHLENASPDVILQALEAQSAAAAGYAASAL